jgi:hypothetical protein
MTWAVPLRAEGDIGSSYGASRTRTCAPRIMSRAEAFYEPNLAQQSELRPRSSAESVELGTNFGPGLKKS